MINDALLYPTPNADYEAKYWWWQILTFIVTLLLCGPMLLLPTGAASNVFLQLLVSAAMGLALANSNPYVHASDDVLAQLCQSALTLAMLVGLLEMAAESFQDKYYGPILVVCTTAQFVLGFVVAGFEWVLRQCPNTVRKLEGLAGLFCSTPELEHEVVAARQLGSLYTRKKTAVNAVVPISSSENFGTESIRGGGELQRSTVRRIEI
jgi:hypothetical protein